MSAQPGTCYTWLFPKPGTVSCCQVTNCTLSATRSIGSSKHKREKIFKQLLLKQGDWWHIDSFPGNQDVNLASELSNTITYWGSQEGQETLLMQAVFQHNTAVKKTSHSESLFDCMMQITVLLKLLVKVQCLFKLLIMACWLLADIFQYDHWCRVYTIPLAHKGDSARGLMFYNTTSLFDSYYTS